MRSLRVLIVEDEMLIALDLQGILEDAGHQIVGFAARASQALDLARRVQPLDLAILDIDLAGKVDGIEVARALREEHGTPVLFVSGHLSASRRVDIALLEPIGMIGKPFRPDQILTALDGLSSVDP